MENKTFLIVASNGEKKLDDIIQIDSRIPNAISQDYFYSEEFDCKN